jgi:hypothetical protein
LDFALAAGIKNPFPAGLYTYAIETSLEAAVTLAGVVVAAAPSAFCTMVPDGDYSGAGTQADPFNTTEITYGKLVRVFGNMLPAKHEAPVAIVWDGATIPSDPAGLDVFDPDCAVACDPTNSNQTFDGYFRIPCDDFGDHWARVSAGVTRSAKTYFSVTPSIHEVDPIEGSALETADVSGCGFAASASGEIYLSLDDALNLPPWPAAGGDWEAGTFSVSDEGALTGTLVVPAVVPAGQYRVIAQDSATRVGLYLEDLFSVGPGLLLNPGSGLAGDRVTVIGAGFDDPGASQILDVTFGRTGSLTHETSNIDANLDPGEFIVVGAPACPPPAVCLGMADGVFQLRLRVPEGEPAGARNVEVVTNGAAPGDMADAFFTVEARGIVLTPDTGYAGETVRVVGTGFVANHHGGSADTVVFDPLGTINERVLRNIDTDDDGRFDLSFQVPIDAVAGLPYTVQATVAGSVATDLFTVMGAVVTLDPDRGPVGQTVAVSGEGFTPDADISITQTVLNTPMLLGVDTATEIGSFGPVQVTILTATRGPLSIIVLDSEGIQVTETFTVEVAEAVTEVAWGLRSIEDYLVVVWGWDDLTQTALLYDPDGPPELNTLQYLVPGDGYDIHVEDCPEGGCVLSFGGGTKTIYGPWKDIGWPPPRP